MDLTGEQRKKAFVQLGRILGAVAAEASWPGFACGLTEDEYAGLTTLVEKVHTRNGWFTPQNVRNALQAWAGNLSESSLDAWLAAYPQEQQGGRTIAIICAGNIPLVGFHDVLTVLITGNKALIKLSSDDDLLIPALLMALCRLEPRMEGSWALSDGKLTAFDAVIATGSNNSSRYFRQYFSSYPHIIRRSRTSVAVLTGEEGPEELRALGRDIFEYFGLGCRNVTKLYIPQDFDLNRFFEAIYDFHPIINHNKYANNYDYNKAIWLLNREDLLDNGFLLLKEDKGLAAPTASLFYERYDDHAALLRQLSERADEIQCIVGRGHIGFGQAQCPALSDYADGVDTMAFLLQDSTAR